MAGFTIGRRSSRASSPGDGWASTSFRTYTRARKSGWPMREMGEMGEMGAGAECSAAPVVRQERLVLMMITPFAPRMPYIVVFAGSVCTLMDSMSYGLIPVRSPFGPGSVGTPSMM